MFRKTFCGGLLVAAALSLGVAGVARAEYPERPVKLVVPYPPGATNDLLARVLAEPLAKELGQNVIVVPVSSVASSSRRGPSGTPPSPT